MGFVAAMWGSEPLMWGSEVSFAINGVRRSEMWGSPSLPHNIVIVVYDENKNCLISTVQFKGVAGGGNGHINKSKLK